MQALTLTLPIVLSVLFWAAYHYHKDRHLPEPPLNLALAFGLGVLAAGLSKLMYVGLEPLGLRFDAVALASEDPLGLLVYALAAIGPIEEFSKLLPFVLVILRFEAFDDPLDGIIYASFIALGYAAVENVHYLAFLSPLEALARSFASPVVHILFASIWAHPVGNAFIDGRSLVLPLVLGFLISAVLHGVYDYLVLLHPTAALPVAAALIVMLWIWRLILMRRLHREAVDASKQHRPPR